MSYLHSNKDEVALSCYTIRMQQIYSIQEVQTQFAHLLTSVANGEEVLIGKAGKPVAKLVALETKKKKKVVRQPGGWKGKIWIANNFDDPDSEIEAMLYGNDVE